MKQGGAYQKRLDRQIGRAFLLGELNRKSDLEIFEIILQLSIYVSPKRKNNLIFISYKPRITFS